MVVDNTMIIIIEPASPQVVYVPTYDPMVVYGVWAYPAYPPYPVYPPPPAGAFFVGVAVGVAWGYAWGHSNWHGGDVDINVNRNTNINTNIDRGKYAQQQPGRGTSGQGKWQHDASHRQGVAYRDNATAKQYGQKSAPATSDARGYGGDRGGAAPKAGSADRGGSAGTRDAGSYDRGGNQGAFGGSGNSSFDQSASQRGQTSRGDGGGGGGGRGGGGRGGRR